MIESSPAHWYQDANAVFTAIIAGATVLYTLVSALLLWNTRKSIKLTRELFQASNRPVVGTQSVTTRYQDEYSGFDITITLTNTGNAPANNVSVDWKVLLKGQGECDIAPKLSEQPIVLIPQSTFVLYVRISSYKFKSVKSNDVSLHTYLDLKYTDSANQRSYYYREVHRFDSDQTRLIRVSAEAN